MSSAWVVKAVDVLEERDFRLASGLPLLTPDQFGFQGFEERLYSGIIIAVAFAAHRHLKALLTQDFLVIMITILAATIRMVNTSGRWLVQIDRHVEGSDCEVLLHTARHRPADDPVRFSAKLWASGAKL